MRTRTVVVLVLVFHMAVVGFVLLVPGCGRTVATQTPESETLMPPREVVITPQKYEPAVVGAQPVRHDLVSTKTYIVRKGDSLSAIAQRHGVTVKELVEINSLPSANKISVNQRLLMPAGAEEKAVPAVEKKKKEVSAVAAAAEGTEFYVVQQGDCLSKIAARHGTSTEKLKEMNELANDSIRAGNKLVVPVKKADGAVPGPAPAAGIDAPKDALDGLVNPTAAPAAPASSAVAPLPGMPAAEEFIPHEVQVGETLDQVAGKYAVTVSRLMKANNLKNQQITAGMQLKIPKD